MNEDQKNYFSARTSRSEEESVLRSESGVLRGNGRKAHRTERGNRVLLNKQTKNILIRTNYNSESVSEERKTTKPRLLRFRSQFSPESGSQHVKTFIGLDFFGLV